MAHHGGEHQWDMTHSQAQQAFYVRRQHPCPTGALVVCDEVNGRAKIVEDKQNKTLTRALKWFNVARIIYGITICMAKLAILSLYRRVFSGYPRSPFDITVIRLMVLLVLFYLATVIIKICECLPRARIWDPSVPGHCIDMSMVLNVGGIFNTVTDLILVIMPFKAVWNSKLKLKQKAYVILAFTFGMW